MRKENQNHFFIPVQTDNSYCVFFSKTTSTSRFNSNLNQMQAIKRVQLHSWNSQVRKTQQLSREDKVLFRDCTDESVVNLQGNKNC